MQAEFYDSFCASDAPLSSAARIPASLVATKGDDWTGGSKMPRNAQMECWRQHGRSLAFAVSARALASGRIGFVALVAMLFAISVVRCEDIVTIRSGRAGKETTRRLFGEITDIRGGQIHLLRNGRPEAIDETKVIRFETEYLPPHIEGKRQFAAANYQGALALLGEAAAQEDRNWVRRDILAQVVACRQNLGQVNAACDTFRIIYASDNSTRHLHAIPLAWQSERATPALQAKAEPWLQNDDNGAARLMAASWLLSGPKRSGSIEALNDLTDNADTRIAQLAQAQLWRTKLVTARETDASIWQAAVDRFPENLRSGPYYLLGRLHSRLKHPEQAALAFLRTPVLFPHQRPLCEQSLLAAARELETMDRLDAARLVYREFISKYPGSLFEGEVTDRYRKLEEKRKKRRQQ